MTKEQFEAVLKAVWAYVLEILAYFKIDVKF